MILRQHHASTTTLILWWGARLMASPSTTCGYAFTAMPYIRRRSSPQRIRICGGLPMSLLGSRLQQFSSTSTSLDTTLPSVSLSEQIKQAYAKEETDGILALAQSISIFEQYPTNQIIEATLEAASDQNKGKVASILNAFIGVCCLTEDTNMGAQKSLELLDAFEELEETHQISPDLVTKCLVYSALHRHDDDTYQEDATAILEETVRVSKKVTGSKRRKALAATRRKPLTCIRTVEAQLQEILGTTDFSVLKETDDYVVINKPSGTSLSHRQTTTSGKIKRKRKKQKQQNDSTVNYNNPDVSLEDALLQFHIPLSTLNTESLGLVHRLDRGSSGALILAKTDHMHALLVTEFFLRKTQKKYLTIVSPAPSADEEGSMDLPVDNRPAKSKYRVLDRFRDNNDNVLWAKLQVEILTGRKHQVRVHCAKALNAPVLWDEKYGGSPAPDDDSVQRFFLHASELCIPEFGIMVQAPLPSWWDDALQKMSE